LRDEGAVLGKLPAELSGFVYLWFGWGSNSNGGRAGGNRRRNGGTRRRDRVGLLKGSDEVLGCDKSFPETGKLRFKVRGGWSMRRAVIVVEGLQVFVAFRVFGKIVNCGRNRRIAAGRSAFAFRRGHGSER